MSANSSLSESKDRPVPAAFPHHVHLVLLPVVDAELGRRGGLLGEHLVLAETAGVREEFFLEILGDPAFDDDIVRVALWYSEHGNASRRLGYTYLVPVPG